MVLAASYVFYAADSLRYLVLLVLITLVSYHGGKALHRRRRGVGLAVYVGATAAPLVLFKLGQLLGIGLPLPGRDAAEIAIAAAIPIGISFYTLQAISHLVDIYRGVDEPTGDLETHALYLAFFPQLLAGPIERAGRLVPQLRSLPSPSREDLYIGAKIVLWGYFCKLVVADNLAGIVDRVLMSVDRVPPASLPVSLYLYSFQLYFDFLGYTMIAIGLGRTFGIRLTRNFDRPYLSSSIREFWRRWHITFSSWLRDYVYIPLGGQRRGYARFAFAIAVTFLISGLWHGAAVNFLLWGAIHAVLFLGADAVGRVWPGTRAATPPWLAQTLAVVGVAVTFSAVSFAWLFFRIEDLGQIQDVLSRLSVWIGAGAQLALDPLFYRVDTLVFLLLLCLAFVLDSTRSIERVLESVPATVPEIGRELAAVNTFMIAALLFGDLGSREFIYFRF